jgi:cytochrome c oxidase subunit 4
MEAPRMHTGPHVEPVRTYVAIFVGLLVLTGITVAVAFADLGPLNNVIALAIAGGKATLVALFFMHLRFGSRGSKIAAIAGIAWLVHMIAWTLADYLTRTWLWGR